MRREKGPRDRLRGVTLRQAGSLALVLSLLGVVSLPHPAGAHILSAGPTMLGNVRYIARGLLVQAPHQRAVPAKLKQQLFSEDVLMTQKSEESSVGFTDGAILNLDQMSTVTLQSLNETVLARGEIEFLVVPGTRHVVTTSAARASALGTQFDVKVRGTHTTIAVGEGAVLVTGTGGSIVVTSGEQTTVSKGHAPGRPVAVSTGAANSWAASIPKPAKPLGENIALAANGGALISASSERSSPTGDYAPGNLIDGNLATGWQSAQGDTTNQAIVVSFQGSRSYRLIAILLDCSATGGEPKNNALKDFTVAVPRGRGETLTPIFSGSCLSGSGAQTFVLPKNTRANKLELLAQDNQGGSDGIALAEIEVISPDAPVVLGTPTPSPTALAIATATATIPPGPATGTPAPTVVPATTVPASSFFKYSFTGLTISYTWEFSPPLSPDPQGPIPVKGTACGSDPLRATWTGTIKFKSNQPLPWTADFATMNPTEIDHPQATTNGVPIGQVTISLRLIAGANPAMELLATLAGQVDKLAIAPSQVPIVAVKTASC